MNIPSDKFKKFYEEDAKLKKQILPEECVLEELRTKLAFSIIPKDIESVLDVGCGEGYLCSILSKKVKLVSGIDISRIRIKKAKKRFKKMVFKIANILSLPYDNDSFDLVLAVTTLEHVPNLKEAIKEMIRVSRKYIAFVVPYKMKPIKIVCFHCLKKFYLFGHIHYFDEKLIKKIAKGNELRIIRIKKLARLPYLMFKSYPEFIKDFLNMIITKKYATNIGVLLKINSYRKR